MLGALALTLSSLLPAEAAAAAHGRGSTMSDGAWTDAGSGGPGRPNIIMALGDDTGKYKHGRQSSAMRSLIFWWVTRNDHRVARRWLAPEHPVPR